MSYLYPLSPDSEEDQLYKEWMQNFVFPLAEQDNKPKIAIREDSKGILVEYRGMGVVDAIRMLLEAAMELSDRLKPEEG